MTAPDQPHAMNGHGRAHPDPDMPDPDMPDPDVPDPDAPASVSETVEELCALDLAADVAAAEQALEDDAQRHRLSANVRASARAAFAASLRSVEAQPASVAAVSVAEASKPLPSLDHARKQRDAAHAPLARHAWVRVAAAVLLVGLASFALWSGGAEPVEAGIRLSSLRRINQGSTVRGLTAVERGRVAGIGEVFRPAPDELLALELDAASMVVLRSGDAVRVSDVRCDAASDGACLSTSMRENVLRALAEAGMARTSLDALFHLDRGELRVSTGAKPVPLWIDGHGLVVVTKGAVHVMRSVLDISGLGGSSYADSAHSDSAIVSLATDSEAVFVPMSGPVVALREATCMRLLDDGAEALGHVDESLFRELVYFGGSVPQPTRTIDVPARRWRVHSGRTRLRSEGLHFDAQTPLRVSWRVPPGLRTARSLQLSLRGPAGLTVKAPSLGLSRQVEAASSAAEPGAHVVELALPENWMKRLEGRPLTLEIVAPEGAATTQAWFDAAAFVVPAANRVPGASVPGASVPGARGPASERGGP